MTKITITLNQIKNHDPCQEGWENIIKAKGDLGYDTPWPLSDALDSNGLDDTLWALRCLPDHDRLWRKYAVWCARQAQHLMKDQRSIDALDVADRHADGLATNDELDAARAAAGAAARAAAGAAARAAARAAAGDAARAAAWDAARVAARVAARAAAWDAARVAQKQKLRQILDAGEWVEDDQ